MLIQTIWSSKADLGFLSMFGQTGPHKKRVPKVSSTTFFGLGGYVCHIAKSEFYDVLIRGKVVYIKKLKIFARALHFLPNGAQSGLNPVLFGYIRRRSTTTCDKR